MSRHISQIFRFIAVGGINTAVDVAAFSLLIAALNFHMFAANMISTSLALAVSYTLNSQFTFSSARTGRTLALFVAVTLAGIWLLQPLVIVTLEPLIEEYALFLGDSGLALVAAKIISIGSTFVWNYLWYSVVIFKSPHTRESTA